MTAHSTTTRRHRLMALGGVALLVLPMALGLAMRVEGANAAGVESAPVTQSSPLAEIVAADKPAVVTITTKMKAQEDPADMKQFQQQMGPDSPYNDFFRQFFGEDSPFGQMPRHRQGGQVSQALGSGFIVSPEGMIVTNNHVIDGATDIKVTLDDGQEFKGTLLGRDAKTDLAVVKIDAGKPLPTVSWGDSDKLRAGDSVIAIGNPFGIGTTVTSGIVSARGRDLHNGPYDDFIQVDAAINHGNSGGPLVDMSGKVVGINTAIYSPNGGNVGVGFAIPSDQAAAVVAKLEQGTTIEHGYIGVQIQPVTKDIAEAVGMGEGSGALVAEVVDGTPAAEAGMKNGDIVTGFAGKPVTTPKDLSRLVADTAPGQKEPLTVWRQGKAETLSITVGRNSEEKQASAATPGAHKQHGNLAVPELGMDLAELTPDLREQLGLDASVHGGVVSKVNPDKAAGENGIEQGDIVLSVNQHAVSSAKDAVAQIDEAEKGGRKSVLLQIKRGDQNLFVGLQFDNA